MKIRLIGVRNNLGIGIHFANFADGLKRLWGIGNLVEEVDYTNQQALLAAAACSESSDINICFASIDLQNYFKGTNIQWIVFESTRIPDIILPTMQTADLVWVPSHWGKSVLISNGVSDQKIDVVAEGVNSAIYHPYYAKPNGTVKRFLSVGKFEKRKSHIETMLAWAAVFGNDPNVELIIKTDHFMNAEQKLQYLQQFVDKLNIENISIIWGNYDQQQMLSLYRSADVFVLPSKGEGWGLPIIEAAAIGLPIVCTNYSGQTEYLQHISNSVASVGFDIQPIDCEEYQFCYPSATSNQGAWAVPRIQSLSQNFNTVYQNLNELQRRAKINAQIIRQKFDWSRCVESAMAVFVQRGLL